MIPTADSRRDVLSLWQSCQPDQQHADIAATPSLQRQALDDRYGCPTPMHRICYPLARVYRDPDEDEGENDDGEDEEEDDEEEDDDADEDVLRVAPPAAGSFASEPSGDCRAPVGRYSRWFEAGVEHAGPWSMPFRTCRSRCSTMS